METTSSTSTRPSSRPRGLPSGSQRVLAATGIAKTYRSGWWPRRRTNRVLRGTDLELWRGEVVGLVGENGSGKSTLIKILVGALDRDAGTVEHTGLVGFCPQEPVHEGEKGVPRSPTRDSRPTGTC